VNPSFTTHFLLAPSRLTPTTCVTQIWFLG
jgi:hypothetical protein